MSFSNQSIVPVNINKPHICKRAGLWRVGPYNQKLLWTLSIGGLWDKAHDLTNRLNDAIRAEQEAAKERQHEFKRKYKEV